MHIFGERERFWVELICFWRGEGQREEDEFYSGNSGVGDDGKGRYAAVKSTKKPLLLFSRDHFALNWIDKFYPPHEKLLTRKEKFVYSVPWCCTDMPFGQKGTERVWNRSAHFLYVRNDLNHAKRMSSSIIFKFHFGKSDAQYNIRCVHVQARLS